MAHGQTQGKQRVEPHEVHQDERRYFDFFPVALHSRLARHAVRCVVRVGTTLRATLPK
jgi:hypothetical protein